MQIVLRYEQHILQVVIVVDAGPD